MPHLWPTGSSLGWPPSITARSSPQALRIPPCDGHPALRRRRGAPGPPWPYPAFAFVPVWAVSIPSALSGQRGITPAFGYGAPHLSARGTSTLPNNALLSTHYQPVCLPSRRQVSLAFRLVGPYKSSLEPDGSPLFPWNPSVACQRHGPRKHPRSLAMSQPGLLPSP